MLGEKQVVKVLLQQDDIDVNCHDSRGKSAAHFAAELRNSSIMQILHESGRFNLNAKDDRGRTPMDIATSKMSYEVITYLREILNLGNDDEEEDNDNEIGKNAGKPVLLDNKCTIIYSPEEDEFDINDKIKFLNRLPIHGAIYDTSNQNEEGEDNNYSLNDTDDFLKAEKLSNEMTAKYRLKNSNGENNIGDDDIEDDNDNDDVNNDKENKSRRNNPSQNLNTEEEEKTIDDLMNSYDADDGDNVKYKNDSNEYIDGSNEFIVLNDPSDDKNVSSSNDLEQKIDSLVDKDVEGRQNDELLEAERLIAITADDDESTLEKTEDFIEDEDITNSFSGQQNKESNSNSNSQNQSLNVSQTEGQEQNQSQEGENNVSDTANANFVADRFDVDDIINNIEDEYNDNVDDEQVGQNNEQHDDKIETENPEKNLD